MTRDTMYCSVKKAFDRRDKGPRPGPVKSQKPKGLLSGYGTGRGGKAPANGRRERATGES